MVVDLINNSDSDKYRFTVIVFFDNLPLKSLIKKNVEVILVEKKSQFDFSFLDRLQSKLKDLKPDLVHGHLFGGDFWGRLATHRLSVPFLTTEHNLNYADGFWKNFFKRVVSSKKDYYAACSMAVSDYMRSVYNIKKEIMVIYNGIDLDRFSHLPPVSWQEPISFLIVGRMEKQKGHLIALQALSNLKDYLWNLTIVGSGTEEGRIVEFIEKNNLSSRVSLVKPVTDIEKYYAQADVLLMPSLWEGLGVVPMEVMASGRLVLCSKVDGLREIVHDQETGFLANPKSLADWQEKIQYILENKNKCQPIIKNAQHYASENFGLEQMVDKYDKLFSLVIR